MKITPTPLQDCLILQPQVFKDHRGYFLESFNQQVFQNDVGKPVQFVQDNESQSQYGTVRGMHMQAGEASQAKLVRVVKGCVKDVVIDVRPNSPTFKQQFEIELSEDNKTQLFVPKGFLHGFSVLSEVAIFSYKCDAYYDKEAEAGVNPLDTELNIDWGISKDDMKLSEKDEQGQSFKEFLTEL
mgnify:CR=1 FL=1